METRKVLALSGSPRRQGNTETLLAAVQEGIEAAGGVVEVVRVCDLNISPCIACSGCDDTGECVLQDDMGLLYPKILEADRLLLASPIYFYGLTAQAKAVVDRSQALWCRKRLWQQNGRWRDDPARLGMLLAVGATRGARVFEGAILTAKYAFDAMGFAYGGEFLVRGMDAPGDLRQHPEILADAARAGREFMERR